jgi:hypothetical protein
MTLQQILDTARDIFDKNLGHNVPEAATTSTSPHTEPPNKNHTETDSSESSESEQESDSSNDSEPDNHKPKAGRGKRKAPLKAATNNTKPANKKKKPQNVRA